MEKGGLCTSIFLPVHQLRAEEVPQPRSAPQGCTASLPGVHCTYQDLGSRHVGSPLEGSGRAGAVGTPPKLPPEPRLRRTCNNSPEACLRRAGRAAHAAR